MEVFVITSSPATSERLKREDFRRTEHDSAAFSQWKILIGTSDWEDHSAGKGMERYRTQNLPNRISGPGVYELGIAASHSLSGREPCKLDSNYVVPVYLGQADNLRTRLQKYGRDGAHLENGFSTDKYTIFQSLSSSKGPGLFTDIFSRGLSIVYRCAPMESKKDAEITEKLLLEKFDYAWNKGSNGARRLDDVCKKLDDVAKASQFSLLSKKLLVSNKKQVGIKIKTCEPCSWQNESNSSGTGDNVISSRTYGIRRLQPRQPQCGSSDSCTDICGVAIGHGSICTAPPVPGRKRCAMHKGMRINGDISELKVKLPSIGASMGSGMIHLSDMSDKAISSRPYGMRQSQPGQPQCGSSDSCTDICGVAIGHGSVCTVPPIPGRKRCAMHKGMRIDGDISKLNAEGKLPSIGVSMGSGMIHLSDMSDKVISSRTYGMRQLQPRQPQCGSSDSCTDICGVAIGHGSVCTAPPVPGRKRCAMHKGMRISGMGSDIIRGPHLADFQDQRLSHPHTSRHPTMENFTPICGFILDNGSPCKSMPDKRNKRCFEHKGRRIH